MFNYCRYNYPKEAVELVSRKEKQFVEAKSMLSWMDETALDYGSSLQGRQKSFSALTGRRKFLPAVLCENPPLVLVPVSNRKDDQGIYLNFAEIEAVRKTKSQINGIATPMAQVRFHDGQIVDLEHPERLIDLLVQVDLYLRAQQARRLQLKKLLGGAAFLN